VRFFVPMIVLTLGAGGCSSSAPQLLADAGSWADGGTQVLDGGMSDDAGLGRTDAGASADGGREPDAGACAGQLACDGPDLVSDRQDGGSPCATVMAVSSAGTVVLLDRFGDQCRRYLPPVYLAPSTGAHGIGVHLRDAPDGGDVTLRFFCNGV
jgi:hypothetical protein